MNVPSRMPIEAAKRNASAPHTRPESACPLLFASPRLRAFQADGSEDHGEDPEDERDGEEDQQHGENQRNDPHDERSRPHPVPVGRRSDVLSSAGGGGTR